MMLPRPPLALLLCIAASPSPAFVSSGSEWTSAGATARNDLRCPGQVFADNWVERWHVNALQPFFFGTYSLLVKNGLVFYNARDASGNLEYVARRLSDGSVAWRKPYSPNPPGVTLYSGPGCIVGNRLFLPRSQSGSVRPMAQSQQIECRDLATGDLQWTWIGSTTSGGTVGSLKGIPAANHPSGRDQVVAVVTDHNAFVNSHATHVLVLDGNSPTPPAPISFRVSPNYPESVHQSISGLPTIRLSTNDVYLHSAPKLPGLPHTSISVDSLNVASFPLALPQTAFALSGETYITNTSAPGQCLVLSHDDTRGFIVDSGGWLYGVDLTTNSLLWPRIRVSEPPPLGTGSPNCSVVALTESADLVVVLDGLSNFVSAYRASTGALAWTTQLPGSRKPANACVLDDETILLSIQNWPSELSQVCALDSHGCLSTSVFKGSVGADFLMAVDGVFLVSHGQALYCMQPSGTPGTFTFCAGDSTGWHCPCDNDSTAGSASGCKHSQGGGAQLRAVGTPTELTCSNLPTNAFCALLRSVRVTSAPFADGDGLRCLGGSPFVFATLHQRAEAGIATFALDALASGQTRYFQVLYRDANLGFCNASTLNYSNGVAVTW